MSRSMTKPTKWCAPSEDSDQPGHPSSLIRVFAVRSVGSYRPEVSSCGQQRLRSDWADAQADPNLRWAHSHCVGFVMRQLKFFRFREVGERPTQTNSITGASQTGVQRRSRKGQKENKISIWWGPKLVCIDTRLDVPVTVKLLKIRTLETITVS